MVRVILPQHLRTLARVSSEVALDVIGLVTIDSVLDALETRYPMLFIRFFACEQDLSHEPPDTRLPEAVVTGAEPLLIVGAMAGG
jgi:sulfur-carrier protein